MPDSAQSDSRQAWLDESVAVSLPRKTWLVIIGAAGDFDARVPREQGDGGECLDKIAAAVGHPPAPDQEAS